MTEFTPNGLVSLLTDFGWQDDYVGQMHAALLAVNPGLRIIDLCHAVLPGDIDSAAFLLKHDARHLPAGTVHVAVVDPGVGSERAILAARLSGCVYLAPDNGLLDPLLRKAETFEVRLLNNRELFAPEISNSFHGRDIFCPTAAKVAGGTPFEELGPVVYTWKSGDSLEPIREEEQLKGKVYWVDRFGNLITNLPAGEVEGLTIRIGRRRISPARFIAEGNSSDPVWIVGSKGTVEIIVNGGSAAKMLGIGVGHEVSACSEEG